MHYKLKQQDDICTETIIFSSKGFAGIYLSTNPSPQDPQNLLLA